MRAGRERVWVRDGGGGRRGEEETGGFNLLRR